jgi:hypothetical protein
MHNKVILIVLTITLSVLTSSILATDLRFCGEPKRDSRGDISRSSTVIAEFKKLFPLPAQYNRNDFQINHAIPLVCGGCDSIENLIWMHKKAKTCNEDYCQDRHEQYTMCPQNFHQ